MAGTFTLLETGRRALTAQQKALETVGHNLANASTPGYSRQEAIMVATQPLEAGDGLTVGTGVKIAEIRRHRDAFLDAQFRNHQGQLASYQHLNDVVRQVEMLVGEPQEVGMMASLERFWMSLNELAQHPASMAARSMVRESAVTLVTVVNRIAHDLELRQRDTEALLQTYVAETNTLLSDLDLLNGEIMAAQQRQQGTSDLEDRRDLLLDRLAHLTGAEVRPCAGGGVRVSMDSVCFLDAHRCFNLELAGAASSFTLSRSDLPTPLAVGGALGGLVEGAAFVGDMQADLNLLAHNIVARFNELHAEGRGLDDSTGAAFFHLTNDARTLTLDAAILDGDAGLRRIAAGMSDAPGDGDNAYRLAQLHETLEVGGVRGWAAYWRKVVAQLGVRGAELERRVDMGRLLVKDIDNRREMVKGVSLDEEVTHLIRHQHAYAAAARLVSAADELLDIIINRMGR